MGNRSSSSYQKRKQEVPLEWEEVVTQRCVVCARDLTDNQLIKGDQSRIETCGQLACAAHEDDGSIRCCSCRRFKPKNCKAWYKLSDGRHLCPDCFPTAVLGTKKLKSLIDEVLDFFKTLYDGFSDPRKNKFPDLHKMDFPILSAELNEILQKLDKNEKGLSQVGGLTIRYSKGVVHGVDKCKIKGEEITATKSSHQLSGGRASGILILFGLPKVLTSSWLVHEMMRAWLLTNGTDEPQKTKNGYERLGRRCEKAICEMMEHIWLDKLENSTSSRSDPIRMHLIHMQRSTLKKFRGLHTEAKHGMQGNCFSFLVDEIIEMKKSFKSK